jgi:hypothetical protein
MTGPSQFWAGVAPRPVAARERRFLRPAGPLGRVVPEKEVTRMLAYPLRTGRWRALKRILLLQA